MIYRVDKFIENSINPITNCKYDNSWSVLLLTDCDDYQYMCGSNNGCAYTIKISRLKCRDWKIHVKDFIDFNEANDKNIILAMSEKELSLVQNDCLNQKYDDSFVRDNEPTVLIHSTPMDNWDRIRNDGMLKCWNRLKTEKVLSEEKPIGSILGDPSDFSNYIMFGGGVSGEIVVSSRQAGNIIMDVNKEYHTGARLYFNAKKMASDGLIIRDGCHMKVKDCLPLEPYLLWATTWKNVGLKNQISTPKIFAEKADNTFSRLNITI